MIEQSPVPPPIVSNKKLLNKSIIIVLVVLTGIMVLAIIWVIVFEDKYTQEQSVGNRETKNQINVVLPKDIPAIESHGDSDDFLQNNNVVTKTEINYTNKVIDENATSFYFDRTTFEKDQDDEGVVDYVPVDWELTGEVDKLFTITPIANADQEYKGAECEYLEEIFAPIESVSEFFIPGGCGAFFIAQESGDENVDVYVWVKATEINQDMYIYRIYKDKSDILPQVIIDKVTKDFKTFLVKDGL